jgi:sulfite reductase alpha subunit-like flavoprotein
MNGLVEKLEDCSIADIFPSYDSLSNISQLSGLPKPIACPITRLDLHSSYSASVTSEHTTQRPSGHLSASISQCRVLTTRKASKKKIELIIAVDEEFRKDVPDWLPGDAIGICAENPVEVVERVLLRLGVVESKEEFLAKVIADTPGMLSLFLTAMMYSLKL